MTMELELWRLTGKARATNLRLIDDITTWVMISRSKGWCLRQDEVCW
jgi:hypothetical protein